MPTVWEQKHYAPEPQALTIWEHKHCDPEPQEARRSAEGVRNATSNIFISVESMQHFYQVWEVFKPD